MVPYRQLSIFGIIAVSAAVFALEQNASTPLAQVYGAIPSAIRDACGKLADGNLNLSAVRTLTQPLTAIFLHADVEHILFNMVFLWVFGYVTSQVLGQWWALGIFLISGVCGNILQVCLNLDSAIPIVGASGAISGLAGTYFGLATSWQLRWPDVWPLAHPIPPLQLGAFALLGFLGDVYWLTNHGHGIAYGAHVGGFLSGLAIAALLATVYRTATAFERAGRKH